MFLSCSPFVAPQTSNSIALTGEWPNKPQFFILGVTNMRGSLVWFLVSCPSGLSAQIKGQMIMPETADGFIASVSALCSLNRSGGKRFDTFSLSEDRYVHMQVKNLCRSVPRGKSWKSWAFMPRESCSCALGATTRKLTSSPDLALYSVTGAGP